VGAATTHRRARSASRYDALVPAFVLTVIGDDRVGLVETLADTVSTHGGNWEHSQMAELAGKFAGIVVVTVPADRATDLTEALCALDGLLEISAHPGADLTADQRSWPQLTIDLIGNDHPGIVHEVSAVLSRHGLSIDAMTTEVRDAPMAGGMIFDAHVVARIPPSSDPAVVRADLEKLASELMVDISAAEK
jgi:glycine cleavage system regulatory protein